MTSTTTTIPPAGDVAGTGQDEREARLVRVLRRSRGRGSLLVTERWLLGAGAALVVIGLGAVLAGWIGASHTVLVAGQIPYLISGGLLGLALVVLGGFLYFGYWLALLVRQGADRADAERADREAVRDGLTELNRSLLALTALLDHDTRSPEAAVTGRAAAAVATESGRMFHRPDCPIVAGREGLRAVPADGGGLQPCGVCDPTLEQVN